MPGEEAIQPPDSTGPRAPPAAPLLPQTSRWSQPRPSTQTTSSPVTDTTMSGERSSRPQQGGNTAYTWGQGSTGSPSSISSSSLSFLMFQEGKTTFIHVQSGVPVPSFTCSLNLGISTTPLSSLLLCCPSSQDLTGNMWERTNNLLANTGFFLLLPH